MENIETTIRNIQRTCLDGTMSVAEAVELVNSAIGGITRVDYKADTKLKLTNHNMRFGMSVTGWTRRQKERLHELAYGFYVRAQQNGSPQPGEIHIAKFASTKGHRYGLPQYARA